LELQKRINRVSEEFGISKKRIEAVLKLKEHERGMKERGEVSSISSVLLSVPLSLTLSNHDQSRRESLMILNRLVLKTPKQNMVKTFLYG
jgi:hypothetical protein